MEDFKTQPILIENNFWFVVEDGNPVSQGHSLLIPKKHLVSVFDLTEEEFGGGFRLLQQVKDLIVQKYNPEGFNIGLNEGEAAGQTVHHLHIHIIPRYKGDVENPRGGIRHIIPSKGYY